MTSTEAAVFPCKD